MKTEVTELPESRVRVAVGVEPEAVEKRVERAARALAGEMRVPGFRKGKVPAQLVIQRVGREAVVEQALRDSLPEWYERALLEAGITPIGDPKLDVGDLPEEGETLEFSIEVGVRPKAELGEWEGVEVGRAEGEVPDEAVQAELDRLREGFGSLSPVERPAASGDAVVIDYAGTIDGEPFEGSEARDFAVELGREGLMEEFDQALTDASAGDELTVDVTFPDDHRPEELAGKSATFAVTVKEVREKDLPELDDDFASDASEFETLDELREEIRGRLREAIEHRVEDEYRAAAVDAAAEQAKIELPMELVHARAHEMWDRIERSLQARGIDPAAYARMQGKDRHDLINDAEPDAEKALRREATLAAVADAAGIEVSDDDLIEALGPGEGKESPETMLARLRQNGRDALLRDELRLRKAADLVVERAKPIPLEQAAAREAIWTPEKGEKERGESAGEQGQAGQKPGELWTPGS
ncbi:MAG TPA: trigger factor [Solirubrobacterales bacterium]|jgi:trigger factor|nr:trigger factor [Solirubrobacterales bacterium]